MHPAGEMPDAMTASPTRRRLLQRTALLGLVGTVGCLGDDVGRAREPTDDGTATPESTPTETATPDDATTDATNSTPVPSLDEWLAGANGYRDEVRRVAPGSQPTISVGHPTDDGIAFDPPAIEVPPMTKVTWDWAGHGGRHNVVSLDGTFDSGRTNAQSGTAFSYVFADPGTYPFVSEPHRDEGMRGAVVVREPPKSGIPEVDEWVVDSSNFDGTVADATGRDATTVRVGAPGNGGHFAFDPPAVRVSTGTTVRWEWADRGGPHTVGFQDLDAGTDGVRNGADASFEYTFEAAGVYRYACDPHRGLGMKGAVVVE